MTSATYHFYEELNVFLPAERRCQPFTCECSQGATVKHMIEALGTPHSEVELVLLNGDSVDFERVILDSDRLAVYPKFEALDMDGCWTLLPKDLYVRRMPRSTVPDFSPAKFSLISSDC